MAMLNYQRVIIFEEYLGFKKWGIPVTWVEIKNAQIPKKINIVQPILKQDIKILGFEENMGPDDVEPWKLAACPLRPRLWGHVRPHCRARWTQNHSGPGSPVIYGQNGEPLTLRKWSPGCLVYSYLVRWGTLSHFLLDVGWFFLIFLLKTGCFMRDLRTIHSIHGAVLKMAGSFWSAHGKQADPLTGRVSCKL